MFRMCEVPGSILVLGTAYAYRKFETFRRPWKKILTSYLKIDRDDVLQRPPRHWSFETVQLTKRHQINW